MSSAATSQLPAHADPGSHGELLGEGEGEGRREWAGDEAEPGEDGAWGLEDRALGVLQSAAMPPLLPQPDGPGPVWKEASSALTVPLAEAGRTSQVYFPNRKPMFLVRKYLCVCYVQEAVADRVWRLQCGNRQGVPVVYGKR